MEVENMKVVTFRGIKGELYYCAYDNKIFTSLSQIPKSDFDVNFYSNNSYEFNKINKFIIEITQQCTMRCTYCCFSGNYSNMRTHKDVIMSQETIDYCVDFIVQHCDYSLPFFDVCFYGGEPLICLNGISYIVNKLTKIFGDKIHFTISTNGLLLKKNIVDWIFSIPDFHINISIDGNKDMHDKYRKTINSQGSYNRIINNIKYIRSKYPNEYKERITILSTVPSVKDIEELSNTWKYTEIPELIPEKVAIFNPNFNLPTPNLLNIKDADTFYMNAFRRFIKGEYTIATNCLLSLINLIQDRDISILNQNQDIVTCLNEPGTCFISSNGSLYVCEKVSSNMSIGNVKEGFDLAIIKNLNSLYEQRLNLLCSQCWAFRLCQRCVINLNYSLEEQRCLCKIERGRLKLALKYYCLIKDWEKGKLLSNTQ